MSKNKRPRDTNQLAKRIVDISTGAEPRKLSEPRAFVNYIKGL